MEGGFRFLKDPLFFVSSLFVKKPCRIQGLLMVMTLALLVYSVAQRRLRQELARQQESLPNQIDQPTQRPTLRWVFQLLEGIHRVRVTRTRSKCTTSLKVSTRCRSKSFGCLGKMCARFIKFLRVRGCSMSVQRQGH